MDEVEGEVEAGGIVSADLELPQVISGVLRSFSLVMIWSSIQWTTVLAIIARDHTDDMRVRSHDDSGKARRNIPAAGAGNDEGHVVGPAVCYKTTCELLLYGYDSR